MKNNIQTNLISVQVRFHDCPNPEISGVIGTIRGVYKGKQDEIRFVIELPNGTLIDYASVRSFKVLP